MLSTRLATESNQYDIFLMVEKNYCESERMRGSSFADEKVNSIIKNLIENKTIIILEKDGKIIGGTGYFFVEHLFSYEQYLAEIMFFIDKEHRNFKTFKTLYKALEQAWIDSGVKEFHIGSMNGYQEDRVVQLYEFFGHSKTATTLKKVRS